MSRLLIDGKGLSLFNDDAFIGDFERRKTAENKTENDANNRVAVLERRVDRLTLLTQAMWELLRTNSQSDDLDLINMVEEIDGRDGKVDGKISTKIVDCPKCPGKINSKRNFCMVCGHVVEPTEIFNSE